MRQCAILLSWISHIFADNTFWSKKQISKVTSAYLSSLFKIRFIFFSSYDKFRAKEIKLKILLCIKTLIGDKLFELLHAIMEHLFVLKKLLHEWLFRIIARIHDIERE